MAVTAVAAMSLFAQRAAAACQSDIECKGERICVEGSCASPPSVSCSSDIACRGDDICDAGACRAPRRASTGPGLIARTSPGGDTADGATEGILGLIIAGPITLGVAWLATIGVTAGIAEGSDAGTSIGFAATPLAGPWILMAEGGDDYAAPLAISGVLQAGGLAMLVVGLAVRHPVEPTFSLNGDVDVTVSASASPRMSGVFTSGTF